MSKIANTQVTTKIAVKKVDKAGINKIMDENPLLAGLDDYILSQAMRKKEETPTTAKAKEKKKNMARKTKTTTPGQPKTQRSPKTPKPQALDPNAILLSVIETCKLLKISRATLVRMDKSGKLPGRIKLGGSVRFHRETLETWLQRLISAPMSSSSE